MQEDFSLDFKTACSKADEILVCSNTITTFPFSLSKVMDEFTEIEKRPFSSLSGKSLSPSQIVGSDDGALLTDGCGNFLIYYNEEKPQVRLRFTLGHEFGHYMLGHDMELVTLYRQKNDPCLELLYKKYEAESNMFAAQLLMPEQIIMELARRGCQINAEFLQQTFKVSKEAAEIRIKNLNKAYNLTAYRKYRADDAMSCDDIILRKFKPFIDCITPRKDSFMDEFEREEALERERQSWY